MDPRVAAEPDVLDTRAAGGAAVRGGALRVAGYAAGVVVSIVSAALLFRHLGVVRTGQYVTVVSLVAIAQGLTDVGISALGVREMSVRDPEGQARLMRALLGLRLVMTTAGVAGATAFSALAGYDSALVAGTVVAGAGLVVQNVQGTLAISMLSRLRLGWVTVTDLVRQVASMALIVGLVAAGASLVPFLAVPIGSGAVALAITVLLVRHEVPLRPSLQVSEWAALVREALAFVIATAVYALYFRIAVVIVSLIATAEAIGYFGAAFRIVEVLILIPGLAVSAVFPIFARAARDDLARLAYGVERTFQTATICGVGMALALALAAPFAIEVVAGSDFEPAAPILRIQAVALAAAFISQAFGYALLSLRRHRPLLIGSTTMLVVASVLTAVLASSHGGEGAAVAVAAGEVGLAIGYAVVYSRAVRPHRLALGVVPRCAAAAGAGVGLALLLGGHPVVMAAVATLVYMALLLVLRGIPDELLEELRRVRGGRA